MGLLNMKDKIAVLIPCYNEAKTIANVVRDYKEALPNAVIYVYDNNSSDGTDIIARNEGAIVRYERLQGKGNVVRSMFRDIEADCYLMIDGDDTYPADKAREMIDLVLNHGSDMVIGDRLSSTYFTENKRFGHNFGNVLVRILVNMFFGGDFRDIMTGMRAMSYKFVKSFPVVSKGFEIETEMAIHTLYHNMKHDSVIIEYRDRPVGSVSKLNTVKDGIKILFKILLSIIQFKPMLFFGVVSAISLLIGMIVDNNYLIIKNLFIILGISSALGGIIGIIIEKNNKQLFELYMYEMLKNRKTDINE